MYSPSRRALLTAGLLLALSAGAADEPPEIPVGLNAYRQWERWPHQRVGARAYLRSTYDRKLDYAFPNQRVEVSVAEASRDQEGTALEWRPAGVWYLAGPNTCVYSNPQAELGPTRHVVQTSNRRFRDDEFLVPRELTEGRSAIRVRVRFTPVKRPLFPGRPLPELAWSEVRYTAYCFVLPGPPLRPR